MKDKVHGQYDWGLLGFFLVISGLGLINLLSASSSATSEGLVWVLQHPSTIFKWQSMYVLFGLLLIIVATHIDYRVFERLAYPLYGIGILLLIGVLFFGKQYMGARRWIEIGSFRFQPGEPCKLLLILALAKFFHHDRGRWSYGIADLIWPMLLAATPLFLLYLEPDLGTGLFYFFVAFSMMMFAGLRIKSVFVLSVLGVIGGLIAYKFLLHPYQQDRIITFIDPQHDPLGRGYHAIQSIIAVGSGRVLGKGYLAGSQSQLKFLPEQHTDFIFSVLAEEWGFVGCFFLLLLYFGFIAIGISIAAKAKDRFGAFMAIGIVSLFFWQIVVNIGAVIGVLPITGVTLPFLSYGGSSFLTLAIGVGLLQNINMRRFMF